MGVSHSFVCATYVDTLELKVENAKQNLHVLTSAGGILDIKRVCPYLEFKMGTLDLGKKT